MNRIVFLILLSFSGMIFCRTAFGSETYSKAVVFSEGSIQIESCSSLPPQPKIGLVLSGGGSRGLVHVGVLKALEEANIPIDLIVGTSIGSMLGGLYASGYSPEELIKITNTIKWQDIYKDKAQRSLLYVGQKDEADRYLVSVRFEQGTPFIPSGYSYGQNILSILSDLILRAQYQAGNDFNNLHIPFRSVATDLITGNQVVLAKGNLAESINASMAVPLLFSPVVMDSMLLVDGGLRSNLPVQIARSEGMDIVIAVDVTAKLRDKEHINAPWEIVDQATTIMTKSSKEMEEKQADILIKPDLGGLLNDDFTRSAELVEMGYRLASKSMNSLSQDIADIKQKNIIPIEIKEIQFSNIEPLSAEFYGKLNMVNLDTVTNVEIEADLDTLIGSGKYEKVFMTINNQKIAKIEGVPFRKISKIYLSGYGEIDSLAIVKTMFSREGELFTSTKLKEDLMRFVELYRKRGYSLMQIEKVRWHNEKGLLEISIDEGRIDRIQIKGNKKSKKYVILREFSAHKNAIFNWKKIRTAIQNVYAAQLYERVGTDVIKIDGQNVLIVKVKEKSSQILRMGGKFDTDRRAQAYFEIGDESFFGTGIKTTILSRFGTRDGRLGLRIRDDRIFFSYFTFDLQGYRTWQINPLEEEDGSYRETRLGVKFQAGRQIRRIGQLVFELRNENIEDETNEGPFPNQQNIELRTFALRALTDRLDRTDFPTKGIYNHWAWETGNRLVLETKESYTKALVNLEGYYTFHDAHTWHLRMFVGIGDKTIPFSENFRLGGLKNFYGLLENQYYGRQLFSTNLEYRFKLPFHFKEKNFILKNSYLSGRWDFGGIWKNPELVFSSDDFFSGAGINLGIETILGPMQFAYGRTTRGDGVGYFSLGFNY